MVGGDTVGESQRIAQRGEVDAWMRFHETGDAPARLHVALAPVESSQQRAGERQQDACAHPFADGKPDTEAAEHSHCHQGNEQACEQGDGQTTSIGGCSIRRRFLVTRWCHARLLVF